jgi:hypothetical protein
MNHPNVLQVYQFDQKRRYGSNSDGGYVVAQLDGYDCYISAGISNEESFSRDFLQDIPLPQEHCYGFDGTIEAYPYEYTQNVQFIRNNIGDGTNDTNDLKDLIGKYQDIFLKMDIEGGEYPWLLHLEESHLNSFKQIVLEFHGLTDDGWGCTYTDKVNCLEKLTKTHYLVHAHGNNYGAISNLFPDVLELTYVHKKCFPTVPPLNQMKLPTPLDFPNQPGVEDIDLNFYPFYGLVPRPPPPPPPPPPRPPRPDPHARWRRMF